MTFTSKSRFVKRGNHTYPTESATYEYMAPRYSVNVELILTALNDIDALSADIQDVYFNAPCKEKLWYMCVCVLLVSGVGASNYYLDGYHTIMWGKILNGWIPTSPPPKWYTYQP